jgi:hypothetical protein
MHPETLQHSFHRVHEAWKVGCICIPLYTTSTYTHTNALAAQQTGSNNDWGTQLCQSEIPSIASPDLKGSPEYILATHMPPCAMLDRNDTK